MSMLVERNEKFLEKLKNNDFPEERIPTGVGSFFMNVFEDEDAIPLFFDFLSWYTGEDYSNEVEWIQECLEAGHKEYEKFKEEIEEHPLMGLLLAMCD